jgi:hypothetical protein
MGLDMYLERTNKNVAQYVKEDLDEIKKSNPTLYETLKPYIKRRGSYFSWDSLCEEVGYWRKANQVHGWFVENVQDGCDDCDSYEVSKEDIEELQNCCKKIIESTEINGEKIKDAFDFIKTDYFNIIETAEIKVDTTIAQGTLPSMGGFFFGELEYDEYYFYDICQTLKIIEDVLLSTDFENEILFYQSSW